MKINEVETLVGITKKNIRFYEEQGLLTPRRDSRNGYREYGQEDVDALRRIKLLRKLGVPLEEIRAMRSGGTVADGMRRHLVTLERERCDLEQAMELCRNLKGREIRLEELDAAALLEEMEHLERRGTTFWQVGNDRSVRYVAPVLAALGMVGLMAALLVLMGWAFRQEPGIPVPAVIVMSAFPVVVICGVLLALVQRIREIGKGEIDDAKHY